MRDGENYDFITLSHVIEHVYDPVALINACYALLNDGGILWIETPNGKSTGYEIYKSSWRGLEPPRHLMLFTESTLSELLFAAGFKSIDQKLHAMSGVYMGLASERLLEKTFPCDSTITRSYRNIMKLFRMMYLELMQLISKEKREFLTLVVKK